MILKRFIFLSSIFFVFAACLVSGAVFFVMNNHVIDFSSLAQQDSGKPSVVLDDEGNEIARFALDKRAPITYEQLPTHLVHAFIAAEDWGFFSHVGISWKGIVRSILVNLYHGRKVQGASTITQQLIKLLFLNSQKRWTRKIKEQLFAIIVEQQFTKEQILETYLNNVYFGQGIYGVEAAAQRLWGKRCADLTLDESAVLAAIIRSPGNYNPWVYPLSTERRRNVILKQMKKLRFITETDYEAAIAAPLHVIRGLPEQIAPYALPIISARVERLVGKHQLYSGGLVIQTTLNKKMQIDAEQSFAEHLARLKKTMMPEIDGGMISMSVKTGEIKAIVGGANFEQSKFNRAWNAKRQLGSIFKALIYSAAIEQGAHFYDTQIDEPFEIKSHGTVWRPRNYNLKFEGEMTLARALSYSNNIVAIKTLLSVGAEQVINLARACGITAPMYPFPSLALGCVDTTLKEAVGMLNVFANDGMYQEPHLIKWIKNKWGTKLFVHHQLPKRVIDSKVVGQVNKVLQLSFERYRKMSGSNLPTQVISKTGTTNESRTCWFIGATPELITGLYIGCDDNRSLGENVFPLRTAFPIWISFNKKCPIEIAQFELNPSLKEIRINEWTGQPVLPDEKGITILR
jgi:penicillin-binding protein 1A